MNDLIRVTDVHKTYYGRGVSTEALRGVDLDIDAGSFTCLVGPSGHGKSTLLHLLGGLDRPTQGSVSVLGEHIEGMNDARLARFRAERIGFVFQFFNLLKGLTVLENVQVAMMMRGVSGREQTVRATELLESVGLAHKLKARANELSGGQMQRVAIARALANDPDVLLLDEPTGNLDSASEADVLAILAELHERGKTLVMVTHSMEVADRAQRVVEVRDGRIAA
ncbi:MAG: ABC transporter ATP-binding protein [Coriobacteriia bacterium]|nr:ABC transporter ATP-binding protein [Coriobacteriia bacterium]